MSLKLIGRKKGMAQLFDQEGRVVVCTVIHVEPNQVVQVKRPESDGYSAIQVAGIPLSKARGKNLTKPMQGHLAKAGVAPHARLRESRVGLGHSYQAGQTLSVDVFEGLTHVDVQGISKGKGYQGVIKLHGFAGGPAAHGSGFHRHAGSTGQRSTPGRCFPNGKRASRMGGDLTTVQSLRVIAIKGDLLLVEGAVPGSREGIVTIQGAVKKIKKATQK